MNNQLTELLTKYGPIGAIWFDGWWDQMEIPTLIGNCRNNMP